MTFKKKVEGNWVWSMIRDTTSCLLTKGAFQIVFVKKKISRYQRWRSEDDEEEKWNKIE